MHFSRYDTCRKIEVGAGFIVLFFSSSKLVHIHKKNFLMSNIKIFIFFCCCFCLGNDDCPAALKKRLQKFSAETQPILDIYKNAGIIHNVSANDSFDNVWKKINACLSGEAVAEETEKIKSSAEKIRMLIFGPPGAGNFFFLFCNINFGYD